MRGSGLSLERFIKGKAQRTKADAKSKKKVIIRKAQRKREYEKVKKREGISTQRGRNPVQANDKDDQDDESSGPTSFYDRFFKDLKKGNVDNDNEETDRARAAPAKTNTAAAAPERRPQSVKPDPFFKAKKKAEAVKMERQKAQEEKQQQRQEVEKKLSSRKKRHVKLSQRTASGQPVVKNHITDILSRLQAEKKGGK